MTLANIQAPLLGTPDFPLYKRICIQNLRLQVIAFNGPTQDTEGVPPK